VNSGQTAYLLQGNDKKYTSGSKHLLLTTMNQVLLALILTTATPIIVTEPPADYDYCYDNASWQQCADNPTGR
jgi:hypothetical protein